MPMYAIRPFSDARREDTRRERFASLSHRNGGQSVVVVVDAPCQCLRLSGWGRLGCWANEGRAIGRGKDSRLERRE